MLATLQECSILGKTRLAVSITHPYDSGICYRMYLYVEHFDTIRRHIRIMAAQAEKRKIDEAENEEEDDEWIGPMPSEAAKPKKKKGGLILWVFHEKDLSFQGRSINSLNIAHDTLAMFVVRK